MISVGCDFGLRKSGIVVLDPEFNILSQNFLRVPEKVKGAERLVNIEKGFDFIIQEFKDSGEKMDLFVEGYAYGAKYQRESLAELGGVIRRYLHLANLDFWIIPPTSLKMFVTGTGKASKNYMKKCTKEKWGETFKSDDVCDGYGLARLGMNALKCRDGIQKYDDLEENEQQVMKELLLHEEYYKNSSTARKRPRKKTNVQTKRTIKS